MRPLTVHPLCSTALRMEFKLLSQLSKPSMVWALSGCRFSVSSAHASAQHLIPKLQSLSGPRQNMPGPGPLPRFGTWMLPWPKMPLSPIAPAPKQSLFKIIHSVGLERLPLVIVPSCGFGTSLSGLILDVCNLTNTGPLQFLPGACVRPPPHSTMASCPLPRSSYKSQHL